MILPSIGRARRPKGKLGSPEHTNQQEATMGEIMRWRVTRPAQRRVPASESLLNLGAPSTPPVNDVIEALQKKDQPTIDAAISSYSNLLSSALALRRYLTTGNAGA